MTINVLKLFTNITKNNAALSSVLHNWFCGLGGGGFWVRVHLRPIPGQFRYWDLSFWATPGVSQTRTPVGTESESRLGRYSSACIPLKLATQRLWASFRKKLEIKQYDIMESDNQSESLVSKEGVPKGWSRKSPPLNPRLLHLFIICLSVLTYHVIYNFLT